MYKYLVSIFLLLPLSVLAVDPKGSLQEAASGTGLVSDKDPVEIIVEIINILLYFLGSIVIILILWAGFKWMTSAGNADAIKKSRETILNAVIGLIIIFASYAILNFVFDSLIDISSGSATGGAPATVAD
ncbi:MAG: hypothetical protein QG603_199 [Patescibacteria group bacterium]|jgi:hypothetical protein|nr:hypothetical protein [Patescibacteria group bacterium]MDQ5970422.1 hypothetical protein [Patescibacteria group bacterium]